MTRFVILPVCALFLLGGCTGSFDKVSGAFKDAPDWYDAKRKAVSDDGYPNLGRVPDISGGATPGTTLAASRAEILDVQTMFATDPRAQLPTKTPADIQAEADAIRAELNALDTPTDFLTEQEIEAIRKSFDLGRAKLKL